MRNSSRSIPGGKFTTESQRHGENLTAESACFPLCLYVVSARWSMEGWESRRFGGRGRPPLHNDQLAFTAPCAAAAEAVPGCLDGARRATGPRIAEGRPDPH